jgi:protocatechuate 3,4-dioxygenase beta subunit
MQHKKKMCVMKAFDRQLLFFAWLLVVTVQLPEFTVAQTCPATGTPTDMLGPFYEAGSTSTTRIGPASELNDPTKRLTVTGRLLVKGASCATGIPNVNVEVWYAGTPDASNNFYQDVYRGQFRTNATGHFAFVQTFPRLYTLRPILHDHFRLSTAAGKQLLVTQMYFQGSGQGYVEDPSDYNMRVVTIAKASDGSRKVNYEIYLSPGQCVARGTACQLASAANPLVASCCTGSVCRRASFPSGPRSCQACRSSGRCDRHADCCSTKRCLATSTSGVKQCQTPSA